MVCCVCYVLLYGTGGDFDIVVVDCCCLPLCRAMGESGERGSSVGCWCDVCLIKRAKIVALCEGSTGSKLLWEWRAAGCMGAGADARGV